MTWVFFFRKSKLCWHHNWHHITFGHHDCYRHYRSYGLERKEGIVFHCLIFIAVIKYVVGKIQEL